MRGLWISGLQECKGNGFFKVGRAANSFRSGPKNMKFMVGRLPLPESTSPVSSWGGGTLTSPIASLVSIIHIAHTTPYWWHSMLTSIRHDGFIKNLKTSTLEHHTQVQTTHARQIFSYAMTISSKPNPMHFEWCHG